MKIKAQDKSNNLAGYPLYKPEDDIFQNDLKIDVDVDKISDNENELKPIIIDKTNDIPAEPLLGENDITEEDLQMLGAKDQNMDGGEDETLIPLVKMNDQLMGGDLDVPGNDYNDTEMDPEDEENNLFSRGQD